MSSAITKDANVNNVDVGASVIFKIPGVRRAKSPRGENLIKLNVMATCQFCGQTFTNALQLGAHVKSHHAEDEVESGGEVDNDEVALITAPAPLCDLARRPPGSWGREQNVEVEKVGVQRQSTDILSRDYREVCM